MTREQIINDLAVFVAEVRGCVAFKFNADGLEIANKYADKILLYRHLYGYLDGLKKAAAICLNEDEMQPVTDRERDTALACATAILSRAAAVKKEQRESAASSTARSGSLRSGLTKEE